MQDLNTIVPKIQTHLKKKNMTYPVCVHPVDIYAYEMFNIISRERCNSVMVHWCNGYMVECRNGETGQQLMLKY